jgi:lipoate-protein ligase A
MAIDEALVEGYAAAAPPPPPPTLRLYGWSPPALSLGRNQDAADSHRAEALRARGIDLVRRPTGGRGVLHDAERTYSVAGSLGGAPFSGGVLDTYLRIAVALADALGRLGLGPRIEERRSGPPSADGPAGASCFEATSTHEIHVGGRKLVGSAQLRRRGAFLQHGSIPLRLDTAALGAVFGRPAGVGRFTDLERLAGGEIPLSRLDRALIGAFETRFEVRLERGALTPREAQRAEQLRCWKYESATWTYDGHLGDRERRWGPLSEAR